MRITLLLLLAFTFTATAADKRPQFAGVCPTCSALVKSRDAAAYGSRIADGGTVQEFSIHFKCAKGHEFTGKHDKFTPVVTAVEVTAVPPMPVALAQSPRARK